ncbi:hypothetical protein ABZP36_032518 [Zizania latifolia]
MWDDMALARGGWRIGADVAVGALSAQGSVTLGKRRLAHRGDASLGKRRLMHGPSGMGQRGGGGARCTRQRCIGRAALAHRDDAAVGAISTWGGMTLGKRRLAHRVGASLGKRRRARGRSAMGWRSGGGARRAGRRGTRRAAASEQEAARWWGARHAEGLDTWGLRRRHYETSGLSSAVDTR